MNSFPKNDSKNWTFFLVWFKELNLVSKKETQGIEFFLFKKWLIELNLFLWTSFQYDSRWSLFSFWLKELNLSFIWATFLHDSKNWIFPIWLKDFFKLTQRVEPTFVPWLKEMTLFLQNDAQNWTLILNLTERMESFFFEYDAKNWILFLWIRRKRIESFFFEYDAKNWTLRLKWLGELNFREKKGLKDLNLPFWTWLQELNFSFQKLIERMELKNDSNNWTLLINITPKKYDSKNWTFFWIVTQKLKFLVEKSQKIKLSFLKTQNLFFLMTGRIEPVFFNMTQRIEPFFSIWLKDFLNRLEESYPFFNTTQRIEPFLKSDSFFRMISRIEPLFWKK